MATPEQIQKALSSLDVGNDNHWTNDGLPRLETVKMLAGDQSLTREAVTQAAPGFSRAAALQALQAAQAPAAPTTPPPVADPAANALPAAATPVATVPAAPALPTGIPDGEEVFNPNPRANIPAQDNAATLSELGEELLVVEKELEELDRVRNEVNQRHAKLQSKADDLKIRMDKLSPASSNMEGIMAYLKSRQQAGQQRAQQIGNIRNVEQQLGVRLMDLVPKRAPIDAARARKR